MPKAQHLEGEAYAICTLYFRATAKAVRDLMIKDLAQYTPSVGVEILLEREGKDNSGSVVLRCERQEWLDAAVERTTTHGLFKQHFMTEP